jgi:hypothetical protein
MATSSSPNKRRRKTSVSFAQFSSLQYVDTHENTSDVFYSKHELESIKHRNQLEVQNLIVSASSSTAMAQFPTMEFPDTINFLGLESRLSRSIYREILQRRKARCMAVLCEQNRQRSIGINDPCMLANISEVESAWARKRARVIAMLHVEERSDQPLWSQRRKARCLAVLCEQNRQRSIGIDESCMLANISEVESASARKRARIGCNRVLRNGNNTWQG